MFIETLQTLWRHAEFTVRLSLPEPIELDCMLKHIELARGMGVEFKDVPETERKQLERSVASLTAERRATRKLRSRPERIMNQLHAMIEGDRWK
jgi:hypothetical protein